SFAGLDSERLPQRRVEGTEKVARAATDIEQAPALQIAGREKLRFIRLRAPYPIERGIAAPVIVGIENGEFVLAHLRQRAQHPAALATRNDEGGAGVA